MFWSPHLGPFCIYCEGTKGSSFRFYSRDVGAAFDSGTDYGALIYPAARDRSSSNGRRSSGRQFQPDERLQFSEQSGRQNLLLCLSQCCMTSLSLQLSHQWKPTSASSSKTDKYRVEDKVIAAVATDIRTSMQPWWTYYCCLWLRGKPKSSSLHPWATALHRYALLICRLWGYWWPLDGRVYSNKLCLGTLSSRQSCCNSHGLPLHFSVVRFYPIALAYWQHSQNWQPHWHRDLGPAFHNWCLDQ